MYCITRSDAVWQDPALHALPHPQRGPVTVPSIYKKSTPIRCLHQALGLLKGHPLSGVTHPPKTPNKE